MTDFYADSSVLVKRHIHETGTAWFRILADPAAENVIITAQVEGLTTDNPNLHPSSQTKTPKS